MKNKKKILITIIIIILIVIITLFTIKNNIAKQEETGYQLELVSEYGGVRCIWTKLTNFKNKEKI